MPVVQTAAQVANKSRPRPGDLIFRQVKNTLIGEGCPEYIAEGKAQEAVTSYRKNKFKPLDCIDNAIRSGRKQFKKKAKRR